MNFAVAMTIFGRTVRISIVSALTVVMLLLPVSLAWCCTGGSMPAAADCDGASPCRDERANCLGMAAGFDRDGIPANARQALVRPLKSADRFSGFDGDRDIAGWPSATVPPVSAHGGRFLTTQIPPPVSFHRPLYLQTARLRL